MSGLERNTSGLSPMSAAGGSEETAILVGGPYTATRGRRVALPADERLVVALQTALRAQPAQFEGWFVPADLADASRTTGSRVLSSAVVAVDVDCSVVRDGRRVKAVPPAEMVERLTRDLPGSLYYRTPHGVRAIFAFLPATTKEDDWRRAAAGAVALIEQALQRASIPAPAEGVPGLFVDIPASVAPRHLYLLPRCRTKEGSRNEDVVLLRAEPMRAEELRMAAGARLQGPAAICENREASGRRKMSHDLQAAINAYNRDHAEEWPRNNGACPVCGGRECFGQLKENETRWSCFHSDHPRDVGVPGSGCVTGDVLDLGVWRAHGRGGKTLRVEFLRAAGYLAPAGAPRPGLQAAEAEEPSGRTSTRKSRGRKQSAVAPDLSLDASKPTVRIVGGALPIEVSTAEAALLESGNDRIYQRTGTLVRVVHQEEEERTHASGLVRQTGAPKLLELTEPHLVEVFTQVANFLKWDGHLKNWKRVDCPRLIAATYLARVGQWRLPRLRALIEAPTLLKDGSILDRPGYDPRSNLYLSSGATTFPEVPKSPTLDDAIAAMARLRDLLRGFRWAAPSDESVAIAAILTALVRPQLRSAPLFIFRAPAPGSGKTLLASLVGILATGRSGTTLNIGKDETENEKRWFAALLAGDPIVTIDNIERPLTGSSLCTILTESTWSSRILGVSRNATVPTCVTILATGNNVQVEGDLTSRICICDLDPQCERPEEREFDVDLRAHALEHRGERVRDALTILRAYVVAGQPIEPKPIFGRFEQWSKLIRGAITWVGLPDPHEGYQRLRDLDPVEGRLAAVLTAWRDQYGHEIVTTARVVRDVESEGNSKLREVLSDVAQSRDGRISARSLGRWLRSMENRVAAGMRLETRGTQQGALRWALRTMARQEAPVTLVSLEGSFPTYAENSQGEGVEGGKCGLIEGSQTEPPKVTKLTGPASKVSLSGEVPERIVEPTTCASVRPCRCCGGVYFWRSVDSTTLVCEQCSPPVLDEALVVHVRGSKYARS